MVQMKFMIPLFYDPEDLSRDYLQKIFKQGLEREFFMRCHLSSKSIYLLSLVFYAIRHELPGLHQGRNIFQDTSIITTGELILFSIFPFTYSSYL